jgi:hypothetical protein
MSRYLVGTLLALAAVSVGCAGHAAHQKATVTSSNYELVQPPDVKDDRYPGGVHVRSDAPLDTWQRVAAFPTREDCESSRIARIDDTIDKARAEVGDRAKFQLPVRQAVNARCVIVR